MLSIELGLENDSELLDLTKKDCCLESTAARARLSLAAKAAEKFGPNGSLGCLDHDLAHTVKKRKHFFKVDHVLGIRTDWEHSLEEVRVGLVLDAASIEHLPVIRTEFTIVVQNGVSITGCHCLDLDTIENVSHLRHDLGRLSEETVWLDPSCLLANFDLRLMVPDQLFVRDHESFKPVHEALKCARPVSLDAVLAVNVIVLHKELYYGLLHNDDRGDVLLTVAPRKGRNLRRLDSVGLLK